MVHAKRLRSARAAFTLIELLAVIGIIGILISLLLPTGYFAIQAARRAACARNLHYLAIAMQDYATQNNGSWPVRHGSQPPNVSRPYWPEVWPDWFERAGLSPSILFCPAKHPHDRESYARNEWVRRAPWRWGEYEIPVGMIKDGNGSWTPPNGPLVAKWLRVDTTDGWGMIAGDSLWYFTPGNAYYPPGGWRGNHTDREGNPTGRNALFADGRVEWAPLESMDPVPYFTFYEVGGPETHHMPIGINPTP